MSLTLMSFIYSKVSSPFSVAMNLSRNPIKHRTQMHSSLVWKAIHSVCSLESETSLHGHSPARFARHGKDLSQR